MEQDLKKLDSNFAIPGEGTGVLWYDIKALPLEGRSWPDARMGSRYDRLPADARGRVPEPVWELSRHSSGLAVRFVSDSTAISLRWKLRFENLGMDHMPATGVSGLDLYLRTEQGFRWGAVGRPTVIPVNTVCAVNGLPRVLREWMLYLPLYNGVESVEIGVDKDAVISCAPARPDPRPLVMYGTSILHGGCASRPGMAYPAKLGRMLDRAVVNLGFSGNGRMEKAMAELLGELDAALYVLDCLPNMDAPSVHGRMAIFLQTLRQARPATPIVMVQNIIYQNARFHCGNKDSNSSVNAAQDEVMAALRTGGMTGLYRVPCADLLGDDGEATVDGVHPTDVGFLRMASAIAPVLRVLL